MVGKGKGGMMDKQREDFEKYMKSNHPFINLKSDAYLAMWNIWKASSIPDGYVVVPKEPTQEMIEAHMNSKVILAYVGAYEKAVESYKKQYKAMIEAVEKNDE